MNIKVTKKLIGISLIMLSCFFCFNMTMAQRTYNFHPYQKLVGNNDHVIIYHSNDNDRSSLKFVDKDGTRYGNIYGAGNGAYFGFLDGDANWSILVAKDDYTVFKINGNEMMRIEDNGNVGIGTPTPEHKLDVCGIGRFKEILVEETWCDYVFEPEYCLTTLEEEAEFIQLYGHLSNFESAKEMDGMINVNDVFKRQQVQIEEIMLHLIKLNEENTALQNQVNALANEVKQIPILKANYEALSKELAAIKKQLR